MRKSKINVRRPADRAVLLLFVAIHVAAGAVYAVDGLIEINQAGALAGGITPSDTAGFPVTLDSSGSYIFTGDLVIPDGSTTAVTLTTNDITIDLNGFGILGSATSTGSGAGILGSSRTNIEVRNGTVRGMGATGVQLGNQARVRDLRLSSNGDGLQVGTDSLVEGVTSIFNRIAGIIVFNDSMIINCLANNNGEDGMRVGTISTVISSRANDNERYGILADGGNTILSTTVQGNEDFGVFFQNGGSGYGQCSANDNNGSNSNPQISGGMELGVNICGLDTTCP